MKKYLVKFLVIAAMVGALTYGYHIHENETPNYAGLEYSSFCNYNEVIEL